MKKITTVFMICLLLNSAFSTVYSQVSDDAEQIDSLFYQKKEYKHYHIDTKDGNEVTLLLEVLFRTYKIVFSSQDASSCVFTPSCSEYAVESIKKKGFFVGFLAAFDRLQRCNPLSPDLYTVDKKTKLLYDPVE